MSCRLFDERGQNSRRKNAVDREFHEIQNLQLLCRYVSVKNTFVFVVAVLFEPFATKNQHVVRITVQQKTNMLTGNLTLTHFELFFFSFHCSSSVILRNERFLTESIRTALLIGQNMNWLP